MSKENENLNEPQNSALNIADVSDSKSYSEEEVYKILLNYQSNYPYASNEIGLKKWFEEIKKK